MVVQVFRGDAVIAREPADIAQPRQMGHAVREAFDRYMLLNPEEDMSEDVVEIRRIAGTRWLAADTDEIAQQARHLAAMQRRTGAANPAAAGPDSKFHGECDKLCQMISSRIAP